MTTGWVRFCPITVHITYMMADRKMDESFEELMDNPISDVVFKMQLTIPAKITYRL